MFKVETGGAPPRVYTRPQTTNITTTNPLTIGSNATIDGNAKLGTVALSGTISAPITMGAGTMRVSGTIAAPSTIDMVNGTASFVDGSVLNGTINTNNTGGTTRVEIHAGHNGANKKLNSVGAMKNSLIGTAYSVTRSAPSIRAITKVSD